MKITVTGTPGTGKTTVADILGEKLDIDVIRLNQFLEEKDIGDKNSSGEREINVGEMVEELENSVEEDVIIEGHLSHHFESDYCIVLRTEPESLRNRLESRDYSEQKIQDNIESERIDYILMEVVERQDNILEIDTTEIEPGKTVEMIIESIENNRTGYGNIDWNQ